MKSPNLDKLYSSINKHMLLVQAYTAIPELFFIIKSCRLKPHDYVFKEHGNKLILYKWWFDEFGNSLRLIKDKKVELIYNDLLLDKDKIVSTDLYYGLSLDRVAKMSKLVYICTGKDEDNHQDCFLLSFLGLDNYLRTYLYLYGEWQSVSPLLLGLDNLKIITKNADVQYFRQFDIKENSPIPCLSPQQWLSFMPPSATFVKNLTQQYESLLPIFYHENT